MKVTKIPDDFNPVVITLESQGEVDALYTVVGNIMGIGVFRDTSIKDVTDELYYGLENCGAIEVHDVVEKAMGLRSS